RGASTLTAGGANGVGSRGELGRFRVRRTIAPTPDPLNVTLHLIFGSVARPDAGEGVARGPSRPVQARATRFVGFRSRRLHPRNALLFAPRAIILVGAVFTGTVGRAVASFS